jgi:hypothetical protein
MTIIESAAFGNGMDVYRTYTMALFPRNKRPRGPSLARDVASLKFSGGIQGDLRSDITKPITNHIENNTDLNDAFSDSAYPGVDRFCGSTPYCSLVALSQHAGADYGLAIHAHKKGWLGKPDVTGFGQCDPLWLPGKSAKAASLKLQAVKEFAEEK